MSAGYGAHRNPALPWGHWLRVVSPGPPLRDEQGGRWQSVRECFWVQRLGMPRAREHVRDEQLELLMAVLMGAGHRHLPGAGTAHDMMEHSGLFHRHHMHWLVVVGLTDVPRGEDAFGAKVNAEGHAVMLMLMATRPPELENTPVAPAAYEILRAPNGAVGPDASRMAAVEAIARKQPQAFVRELHVGRPGISLVVRDGAGLIQFSRTVWSQAFADEDSRDWFYVWLSDRVDRWDAWASTAWRKGGTVLTQHLFALLVAQGFETR